MIKKLIFVCLFVFMLFGFVGFSFGANSQSTGNNYVFATVDTAPGASGYGTSAISPKKYRAQSAYKSLWFTIGGTGTMTVTLQYKLAGTSTWNDYADYTSAEYKLLETGAGGETWRAIVKNGAHTSGSLTFGFTW